MPEVVDVDNMAGPYKTVAAFGRQVPVYLITFDKDGACTSPQSADHLVAMLAAGEARDVLFYSHGWNNVFPVAVARYDAFIEGVSDQAAAHPIADPGFAPVFVGVIWPSTALTFGEEDGPGIAGIAGAAAGVVDADADARETVLGELDEAERDEAEAILARPGGVDTAGAERLAVLLAPKIVRGDDPEGVVPPVSAGDLLTIWRASGADPAVPAGSFTTFGTDDDEDDEAEAGEDADPQAAGLLSYLDPRWIVRLASVLQMKDRAGHVGAGDVAELVRRILDDTPARLFLIGHSYGAKVMLTALAVHPPSRPVEAVLLLQPAVSWLCFATDIGNGTEGGFRRVLDRVRQPIRTTWTSRDIPLRRIFQFAARRKTDPGELQYAAEPSRYAALGGYGPGGCAAGECIRLKLPAPDDWPAVAPGARIVALDGSGPIKGHGDVAGPGICWTMLNLLR